MDRSLEAGLALGHTHVSRRFGYVYIDTPKAGCSTIKRTLQDAERGLTTTPADMSEGAYGYSHYLNETHDLTNSPLFRPDTVAEMAATVANASHVFAFIRNPFTRVLSAYIDKIAANPARRAAYAQSLGWDESQIASCPTFPEFLQTLASRPVLTLDQHWRPQCCHLAGVARFTFIGSFENFSSDLHHVLNQIDPILIEFVKNIREHHTKIEDKLEEFYSDGTIADIVRRIYAEDFERLHYSLRVEDALRPSLQAELAGSLMGPDRGA